MVAIKDMEMPSCCGLCERYLRTCEYRFENAQTKRHPNCPLIEVEEPKTGHWIGVTQVGFGEWEECYIPLEDGFVTDNCHCSKCGEEMEKGERGLYCPNCGIKMESEVNYDR